MKMAKASEADLNMAMELCNALDALTNRWSPTMPEGAATDCDDEESEYFNIDNKDQCRRALEYLIELADRASLMRVVWGCAVMLDPANALVDPDAGTIELHPSLRDAKEQRDELLAALKDARASLDRANDASEVIIDTIWHTPYETLFDFIDAAIEKAEKP